MSYGLRPRTHFIGVQTETLDTYCSFGYDQIYIDEDKEDFVLHGRIVGDQSLINKYEWRCSINGSERCSLPFTFVGGKGNAIQFKPIKDATMKFELHLKTEYPDEFVDIGTCQTTLVVKKNVIPMRLYQQTDFDVVGGFYDPDHWYQFSCESLTF